jgi:hypothetical protein
MPGEHLKTGVRGRFYRPVKRSITRTPPASMIVDAEQDLHPGGPASKTSMQPSINIIVRINSPSTVEP